MTRPICLIQEDAVALKGIVELLAEEPAMISEIAMTQHISNDTARRLLKILKDARIVEKETVPRVHRGTLNYVETLRWKLTSAYISGEVPFEPEVLAGGIGNGERIQLATELQDIIELLGNHPAQPDEIESICKLSAEERRHHMKLLIDAKIAEIYWPNGRALKGYKLTNAVRAGKLQINQVLRGVLA